MAMFWNVTDALLLTVKIRSELPPLIVSKPPPSSTRLATEMDLLVVIVIIVGPAQENVLMPPAATAASNPASVHGCAAANAKVGVSAAPHSRVRTAGNPIRSLRTAIE